MELRTNYELMFGPGQISAIDKWKILPDILPVTLREDLIKAAAGKALKKKQWLLLFVVGTKPCFYKFWGSVVAAQNADIPYLLIDSGQHYDPLLTHGTEEFGYREQLAVNLNIRGELAQKTGELLFKVSWLARYLAREWPGVTALPVVLGDTLMTSIVPAAWLFTRNEKAIQNEAGLRSLSPMILRAMARGQSVSLDTFFHEQQVGNWERMTNEPFPEQYDTFTSAAGAQFLFAPTETNRANLLQEGHPRENIHVIGGVVVDALDLKRAQKPTRSIFDVYPALRRGRWIRVDIHRKENLTPRRFAAIVGAVRQLVLKGHSVNFVEMNATRAALELYGLQRELRALQKRRNFLYTPIWPEYSQVIEFYRSPSCLAALTDSGGLQEELNMLRKTCLTCRFNTDRPETVREGRGNLLIPPISAEFMVRAVEHILRNRRLLESLQQARPLYGSRVGQKFIAKVQDLMRHGEKPFLWAHERLGFWKETKGKTPFL